MSGFGVRVTDTGHRTFILRTRYPGSRSPSRREIGACDVMSLADAREKAREWRSLVRHGVDPAVEEEKQRLEAIRKQAITFGAVAEDFIRQKLPSERKGKDAEREIRRDLLPEWGKRAIADLIDLDVSTLIKMKGRDGKFGAQQSSGVDQAFLSMGDGSARKWHLDFAVRELKSLGHPRRDAAAQGKGALKR